MNVRKGYQLNVDTIESIDDLKIILDSLHLTTYPEGDEWHGLQKYFTTEVDVPQLLTEEELRTELAEEGIAMEDYSDDQ